MYCHIGDKCGADGVNSASFIDRVGAVGRVVLVCDVFALFSQTSSHRMCNSNAERQVNVLDAITDVD